MSLNNKNVRFNENLHINLSEYSALLEFLWTTPNAWMHSHFTIDKASAPAHVPYLHPAGKWEQHKMQVKSHFYAKHFLLRPLNKPWKVYLRVN